MFARSLGYLIFTAQRIMIIKKVIIFILSILNQDYIFESSTYKTIIISVIYLLKRKYIFFLKHLLYMQFCLKINTLLQN